MPNTTTVRGRPNDLASWIKSKIMAKAKTAKTKKEESPFAVIDISMPHGHGKRQNVSIDALDSMTRGVAAQTFVTIDGKRLGCRGFKIDRNGNLVLTVEPVCFKVTEREQGLQ